MYNRYIPDASGIYRRIEVPEPIAAEEQQTTPNYDCSVPPVPSVGNQKQQLFSNLDRGDLLILLILLLLLFDSAEEDRTGLLLMLGCFLL